MRIPLFLSAAAILFGASPAAAEALKLGCTPVQAFPLEPERFESEFKPQLSGAGAAVPESRYYPGASWDLGEKRSARVSLYFTKDCTLGMSTNVRHGHSSPHLDYAVEYFAKSLREEAPDWSFSVEPPNTLVLQKGAVRHSTDIAALIQARLDAATPITLGGIPVSVLFDGGSITITPQDPLKSLHLERATWFKPSWAYYDLTPFGLPKLIIQFDKPGLTLWALP